MQCRLKPGTFQIQVQNVYRFASHLNEKLKDRRHYLVYRLNATFFREGWFRPAGRKRRLRDHSSKLTRNWTSARPFSGPHLSVFISQARSENGSHSNRSVAGILRLATAACLLSNCQSCTRLSLTGNRIKRHVNAQQNALGNVVFPILSTAVEVFYRRLFLFRIWLKREKFVNEAGISVSRWSKRM